MLGSSAISNAAGQGLGFDVFQIKQEGTSGLNLTALVVSFIGAVILDSKSLAPGLDRGFDFYDNFPEHSKTKARWGRVERRGMDVVDAEEQVGAVHAPQLQQRDRWLDRRGRSLLVAYLGRGLASVFPSYDDPLLEESGLVISQRLAELMGGTMWVESAGPGRGSTFHFAIPLRVAEPSEVA